QAREQEITGLEPEPRREGRRYAALVVQGALRRRGPLSVRGAGQRARRLPEPEAGADPLVPAARVAARPATIRSEAPRTMSEVTVTITSGNAAMDPRYEVVSVDVSREVDRIPEAQVVLIDGDAAKRQFAISDTAFFEPGKEVEIKLRYEGRSQDASV